jgi:dimethylaniline monooxygenase (N-oxide forming)
MVESDIMDEKRVCIIGAGVSGLATAKVFLSRGHAVTVFERRAALGGVWAPQSRYPGVRLQTKRQCYSFSDFPMPSHYPEFPSGQQVYEYLVSYAKNFGVDRTIRFSTEVQSIRPRPDGAPGWRVHVRDFETHSEIAQDFDFVVVCNGVFSEPCIPEFAGRDEFEANGGQVLHSSALRDLDQIEGRSVLVVGFGKSALDIAEACLERARSCAIVARRIPWKVPHRIWGRVNIKHFILSRFTEIWYPHPDMRGARRFLHTRLSPLVNVYARLAEHIIGKQLGMLTPELRPEVPLLRTGGCVTLAVDNLRAVRNGSIVLHRGALARFTRSGIELDSGTRIAAQTVVLATGFRQRRPFLSEREEAALIDEDGAILIYRSLVNPDIPAMGFNGYNGVGACQLAAEVGAVWLVRFMEGSLRLPDRAAMMATIREEIDLRKRLLSTRVEAGFYVTPFTFGYLDQLLRDLGLPPADQHRRLFDWLFTPLDPRDYKDLLARSEAAGRA